MILTLDILEKGKSSNNGWNKEQLKTLGIEKPFKGWANSIIGKDYSENTLKTFLDLKDFHFKKRLEKGATLKKKVLKRMNIISFTPVSENIPYKEQYLHPNWQKMRMFVFERDKYTCVNCGSFDKTLHAHHLKYIRDKNVWDVPHWYIVTLCEDCHSKEHNKDLRAK